MTASYAQFGEDEVIDELLGRPGDGLFVDVGAGDGMEISNSRLFRERGWRVILVESDAKHMDALSRLVTPRVDVLGIHATPDNINRLVPEDTTVLSIDVDGDDYFLLEALERRPPVICVEHNPTIPYWIDVHPAGLGRQVGASVAALARVADDQGYGLRAVTECNAIFVRGAAGIPIPAYRPRYAVATDYFTGRPFVVGEPPWGVDFANPLDPGDVVFR